MNNVKLPNKKRNTPYNKLSGKMIEKYFRTIPTILSLIIGLLLGVSKLITGIYNNKPILENISSSIATFILLFFLLISLYIGLQNIFQSGYEEELLDAGINFLVEGNYSEEVLQIIEKRAEIGITAGETRTLVPILFFTITVPVIVILKLPIDNFIYLFTVCSTVLILFLLEVDRSNLDAIIKQVCFIYRIENKKVSQEKGLRNNRKRSK
jgi:hypothetical protein